MEPSKKKRPLQAIAKLFNKSSKKNHRSEEVHQVHQTHHSNQSSVKELSGFPPFDTWNPNSGDVNFKLGSSSRLDMTSPSENNFDEAALEAELEALHMSRMDNPYIQVLSSQDNLDRDPRSPSTSLQSPPSDQQSSTFSPTLSEIHSHLIRSPPPINWPIQNETNRKYYPVSPRSTGTFSPDSCDGLEMDNIGGGIQLDNQANSLSLKANAAPSRGYSPYNCCNTAYSRSHSEEHILSPCRDLLHKSSALFSPIRGANEMMTSSTMSPRSGSCYDYQSRRCVGRAASFASTVRSTGSSRITLNQMSSNVTGSRRSFYYTMSYDDEVDLDDQNVLSPNRNQMSCEFGAISPTTSSSAFAHRRSLAGLTGRLPLSAFSNSGSRPAGGGNGWSCSLNRRRNLSKPDTPSSTTTANQQRPFFFSSWRRSYSSNKSSKRFNSPASNSTKKRMNDVKSMENLISSGNEEPYKRKPSRQLESTEPFDC